MRNLLLIVLSSLSPAWAGSGCVSFAGAAAGCAADSDQLEWRNPPPARELMPIVNRRWDAPECCYDPTVLGQTFPQGVTAKGDAQFTFRGKGPHILEVFLFHKSGDRSAFYSLEAGGKVLDRKIAHFNPQFALVGSVDGAGDFAVRRSAGVYAVIAVRWTPREDFEQRQVPLLRERARVLTARPASGAARGASHYFGEQVNSLLAQSRQPEARREGMLNLTRLSYWRYAEARQESELAVLVDLLKYGLEHTPDDRMFRQLASGTCRGQNHSVGAAPVRKLFPCEAVKPVPWEIDIPAAPAGAPSWAVAQRRLARRLEALTSWWLEHRQRPDGQLGGGWEDDVEVLRSWGPQALGLGSETAARGLRKLAEGLWANGDIVDGFAREVSDSEHSAEDIADTQPLLAAAYPEEAGIIARLKQTTACSENWIVRQPDGFWRFRGSWFNCKEFSPHPNRAIDTHYSVRAMGPALWYASLTRDRAVVERITRWAESWVRAMRSTEHGKPAGIIPSTVISRDGSYLVRSERWDKPEAEWPYFQWSGYSQEGLTSLLLGVYDLTGDRRWLNAAGESFQVMEHCDAHKELCEEIRSRPEAFYQWRALSGSRRYDKHFPGLRGDDPASVLATVEQDCRESEENAGYNFELNTSEPIWTDRVFYGRLPAGLKMYLFGGDAPRGERYPGFAVTWPPVRHEFARAVLSASRSSIEFRLYSFETAPVKVAVRFWRLSPGIYEWKVVAQSGKSRGSGTVEISRAAQMVEFPLPAREEVTLSLRKQ